MFKFIGRKAAQQNYETFILGLKADPSAVSEVRARLALKLRSLSRKPGFSIENYEHNPNGLVGFFRDFEGSFPKLQALEASTETKNYAMQLRSAIGISPNYLALQAISGYLQIIGQCSPNDFFVKGGSDSPITKDGVELRKFREIFLKLFEGAEELLFTDVIDRAAAQKGIKQ